MYTVHCLWILSVSRILVHMFLTRMDSQGGNRENILCVSQKSIMRRADDETQVVIQLMVTILSLLQLII